MTGIFGTPFASIMLAVELLLFEWKPRSFVPVVTAVLVSLAWRPLLVGVGAAFPVRGADSGGHRAGRDLRGARPGHGAAGRAAFLLLYRIEDGFHRLPVHWMWWPAIGAVVVGIGALFDLRVLGAGYGSHPAAPRRQSAGQGGPDPAHRQGGRVASRARFGDVGRNPCALADPRRLRGVPDRPVSSRRPRLLGHDRNGGDHERSDARADDRRAVRRGAHQSPFGASRDDRRGLGRLCGQRADHEALDPDREDRSAGAPHPSRIYRRCARIPAGGAGDDARSEDASRRHAVDEAARFFAEKAEHRSYPVVDSEGRLLGLVSRKDALQWLVAGHAEGRLGDALSDASTAVRSPKRRAARSPT